MDKPAVTPGAAPATPPPAAPPPVPPLSLPPPAAPIDPPAAEPAAAAAAAPPAAPPPVAEKPAAEQMPDPETETELTLESGKEKWSGRLLLLSVGSLLLSVLLRL